MKATLQNKLIEKYPQFFDYLKEHNGPIIPIQFGFECGDGWYDLLDSLMYQISSYTKYNSEKKRIKNKLIRYLYKKINHISSKLPYKYGKPLINIRKKIDKKVEWETYNIFSPINITQIKEKWGGLSFYYYGGDEHIHGLVSFAESFSYKICETCGTTKNVYQTKGWVSTTCKVCENKKQVSKKKTK